MKSLNQHGSTFVVLLLGLVVVTVVGVAGYRIVQTTDTGTISSSPTKSGNVPNTVDSTADIKQADKALDGTAIDSGIDPAQLDSDINALL
ncbi:MAG: hypothetical protein AAB436_03095 [Patescibacteria group bacterium]